MSVPRLLALALLVLAALPAQAQRPAARAVLAAWADDWRRAAAGVTAIGVDETVAQQIDGPRGAIEIDKRGRILYRPDAPPERVPERFLINGQPVDPELIPDMRRRADRAFGPGGRDFSAPPSLPSDLFRAAEALGLQDDRVGGRDAWRIALRLDRGDRAEAWFTRSTTTPRLLRLRTDGRRPYGGRLVRDLQFVRVNGLDVPVTSRTTFTARQRRRLRDYAVTLTADARYTGHRIVR